MRQQRTQQTPSPMFRTVTGLPAGGYALIVDGQPKMEFDTQDRAINAAKELKGLFPMLQVKVYDAETKQSEVIEPAAA
ncbi:hypothetical protein Q2941_41370 [Bradyrhizobium sp. UFLA05-153]